MSPCLYGRCLLLSHSSYLVVLLPPPMILSLVPRLGQCVLWYCVHCRIARCRSLLFVLWSNLDHGFLYSACPGVWSACLALASAFCVHFQAIWCHGRFFLIVLHISAYSIFCLLSPFPAISRRFVIRARVGNDIIDFCGLVHLVIAWAVLDALCWIMSVMASLMVSMLSSSCDGSNRFLNWS